MHSKKVGVLIHEPIPPAELNAAAITVDFDNAVRQILLCSGLHGFIYHENQSIEGLPDEHPCALIQGGHHDPATDVLRCLCSLFALACSFRFLFQISFRFS